MSKAKNLAELSVKYGVTAERTRQLVVKGLRLMRQDVQRQCSNYSHAIGAELWSRFVGDNNCLMSSDIQMVRLQLTFWLLLVLDVCDIDLEEVLDKYVERYGNGWVGPTWQIDVLNACFTRFGQRLQETAFPCVLDAIEWSEVALITTALSLNGYCLFGGLCPKGFPQDANPASASGPCDPRE